MVEKAATTSEISRFLWRAFRSRFRDHRAELSAIRRHIRPGDLVCDVGANKGSFLFWLSRWAEGGRAVAFEPQPDLAQYLSRICASLRLSNVSIEPCAVFSEAGCRELFIPKGHAPGASLTNFAAAYAEVQSLKVPVVSLDGFFHENDRVAVLKIDVEGAEKGVFSGAQRILRRDKPLLVFECETRHHSQGIISDIFDELQSFGYRGLFVERACVKPIGIFREDVHQRRDGEWFWKRSDYCSNFIFEPAPRA